MALIHIDRPKNLTEGAEILNAPISESEILYKKNENGLYEFAGLYDPDIPDEEYPDGMAAFSFRSVFVRVDDISEGTPVWNVEKSSGDKWDGKVCKNWLEVWNSKTGGNLKSDSKICYVKGSPRSTGDTGCNDITIGGHMVLSDDETTPSSDTLIYIIPICNAHNNWHT